MTDAAAGLRELSEPWPSGDKIKSAIGRAADLAGLGYWRAFDIWYRKARRIEDYELEQINHALQKKRELEAANELHDLKLRLARLEAAFSAQNTNGRRSPPDFAGGGLRRAR